MTPSPHPSLEKLKTLLEREVATCRRVEERMRDKKALIIAGDALALSKLDQELLGLSQRMGAIEKERMALLTELGRGNQTLREFIATLPGEEALAFNGLREELARSVNAIRELNQNNRKLLDLSLQWIHSSVEVIANFLTPEGASYNARGDKNQSRKNGDGPAIAPRSTIEHSV